VRMPRSWSSPWGTPSLDKARHCMRISRVRPAHGGVLAASSALADPELMSSPAYRFFVPVVAANTAVFLMWRTNIAPNMMNLYFQTRPWNSKVLGVRAPLSWLGSSFSHVGGIHFGVNMLALYSFTTALLPTGAGRQRGPQMELLTFASIYGAGGMAGGLASNLWQVFRRTNGEWFGCLREWAPELCVLQCLVWAPRGRCSRWPRRTSQPCLGRE
jgi:membrane associated rhomboid family serine protease